MGDFVSISNDEILRFQKTEKLLENKISRRFKIRRLDKDDFGYVDSSGNMVLVKNPTITSIPKKSDYKPKAIESDGTVDSITTNEINEFLTTFFKLYPTATASELYRLYREAGLSLKKRSKKKRYEKRGMPDRTISAPNHRWSMDFVSDRTRQRRKPTPINTD